MVARRNQSPDAVRAEVDACPSPSPRLRHLQGRGRVALGLLARAVVAPLMRTSACHGGLAIVDRQEVRPDARMAIDAASTPEGTAKDGTPGGLWVGSRDAARVGLGQCREVFHPNGRRFGALTVPALDESERTGPDC